MSGTPRLVTARKTLSELKKWLMSKEMKEKYLNIGDDGKLHFKPGKPSLDDNDINYVIDNIKQAISQSLGSVSNDYKTVAALKSDKLIENYLRGLLSTMPYHDNEFLRFASKLINIKSTKPNPYSNTDNENRDNPNIITNIVHYVLNPKQPIILYDKLPTTDELTGIIIDYANKQAEAKANETYAQIINEKQELLAELKGKLSEYENKVANIGGELEKLHSELEKGKGDKQALEKEIKQKNAELEKAVKGLEITKDQYMGVVNGIEQLLDDSGKQNIALGELLGDSKVQNAALGELLKKNKSDILNDVALTLVGNPDLKKNIRKIKGDLKASNPNYSDGEINYIITKALSENERYLKTVAANPDLFDRDMSQDTIQKENEQFQSKLRQQNLRYILPKFIERREKLVENTLNPELLKGAFAI